MKRHNLFSAEVAKTTEHKKLTIFWEMELIYVMFFETKRQFSRLSKAFYNTTMSIV